MKAYEKGFGENHFTEDSLSFILDSYYPEKEEGREVLTFIGPKDLGYLCMDKEESDKILERKSMHRHNFYELMEGYIRTLKIPDIFIRKEVAV